MYALHDTRSPSRIFCVSVVLVVTQIYLHLAVWTFSIESCYPCQVLLLENLLFWPHLTYTPPLPHLSPTNLPVTCLHRGTQPSPIWRFAPDDILFFWTYPFGQTLFRFPFLNHPPTRNLACNLRVTCDHLGTNLGFASNKSCSELGYGTLEGEEELPTGCARFPPSELQTTPAPDPRSRRPASVDARPPVISPPPRYNNESLLKRTAPPPARCPPFGRRRPALPPFRLSGWLAGGRMVEREPPPLAALAP